MQSTAKCWHCLEVPGPLSGTQSAARWLHWNPPGETERPTWGRHNCLNAPSNPLPGNLLSCPPTWALQNLPAWLPTSQAPSWGLTFPSPASHWSMPTIPYPRVLPYWGISTRNREEPIRSFPQSHYPPFSCCSFLLLKVTHTWPSLCQLVGAKNAVTFLHVLVLLSMWQCRYLLDARNIKCTISCNVLCNPLMYALLSVCLFLDE